MSRENEATIEVYEKYGRNYLERNAVDVRNNPRAKADDERQTRLLKQYTEGLSPEVAIFEVGSASGRDAKRLAELGFHNVTVSDATEFFIRNLVEKGFAPIKFNLITDEFPAKYDVILCWAVLVHFTKSEAVAAIRKMYGALNVGGRLILSVKHKAGCESEWDDYQGKIGAKRYFTYWDKEELAGVLKEIGFGKVLIGQHGGARSCWLECCAEK